MADDQDDRTQLADSLVQVLHNGMQKSLSGFSILNVF